MNTASKLTHAVVILAGAASAWSAEQAGSNARWAIAALAVGLLGMLVRKKRTPGPWTLGLWIAAAATFFLPFLPGVGSAYPPTRFLLILASGAFLAESSRWEVTRIRAWHILLLGLWMTALAARSFELHKRLEYGYDLAHVLNLLSNTLEGRFLFSDYTGASILSHHLYLTLALLAPLHHLWPSVFMPQAVQLVLMGAAVLLVTYAAQQRFGHGASVAALFTFFMHPAFQGQALHEFDPGVIGLFALSVAIFAFTREMPRLTILAILAAMLSKEHFAAAGILSGGVLLFLPRYRRDGAKLALMGVAALALFVGLSFWIGGPLNLATAAKIRAGEGGSVFALILGAVAPSRLGYLLHLLIPSGALAVAGWPLLLPALPEIALNMLSRFPMHYMSGHYSTLSLPLLSIATAAGVARIQARSGSLGRTATKYVVACSVLAAFLSNLGPLSMTGAFYDVVISDRPSKPRRLDAVISRLPMGSVGVMGRHRLLVYLPRRAPAIELPYIDMSEHIRSRDFMILDEYSGPAPAGMALIDREDSTLVYMRMKVRPLEEVSPDSDAGTP